MIEKTHVTDQVRAVYETEGWSTKDGVTDDAKAFEDLRPIAKEYISKCRLRVLEHLPLKGGRLLDMASGPIQYPEYLRYSEGFDVRVCVDLSARAIAAAKVKLGARGEYHVGNFLDLAIDTVDAAVSLHTIYHISAPQQEAAVKKLIDLTKPGGKIVIVYSNPHYFISVLVSPLRKIKGFLRPRRQNGEILRTIYFHRYPLSWWERFREAGKVEIFPWRTFGTREQKLFFPSNRVGAAMFRCLFFLEGCIPRFFSAIGCYPMVVITKNVD